MFFEPAQDKPVNGLVLTARCHNGAKFVEGTVKFNVGNQTGGYKLSSLDLEDVTLRRGDKIEGQPFSVFPDKATVTSMSSFVTSGEGANPILSFDSYGKTFSVNAENADAGTYTYQINAKSVDGDTVYETFKVTVLSDLCEVDLKANNSTGQKTVENLKLGS